MMKRRIRIEWTCSDFATHHRHRTYFGAWLCGRAQWLAVWRVKKPVEVGR